MLWVGIWLDGYRRNMNKCLKKKVSENNLGVTDNGIYHKHNTTLTAPPIKGSGFLSVSWAKPLVA